MPKPTGWDEPDKLNAEFAVDICPGCVRAQAHGYIHTDEERARYHAKPVPANPRSSGVSDAPTEQELTDLRRVLKDEAPSYRDSLCGHNYDMRHCPYPHCGARRLYDAAQAMLENFGSLATFTSGFDACHSTHNALAKARGEKPNAK